MFRHVSQNGNIVHEEHSEEHRETSNVSEFARKHFCFSGSKFCFRNNVSTGGQTGKHLRKHRENHKMFPQQCFLQFVQGFSVYFVVSYIIYLLSGQIFIRFLRTFRTGTFAVKRKIRAEEH